MDDRRWLTICWEDKFDELEYVKSKDKNFYEGILFINPPFADITLVDGFWKNLNQKFNKMFDMAEEEEIETNIIPDVINEIIVFSKNNYDKKGYYEQRIGVQLQPEKKEIFEKMTYDEIKEIIKRICDFLLEANKMKKNIIAML